MEDTKIIKGFELSNGEIGQYDYESLVNKPNLNQYIEKDQITETLLAEKFLQLNDDNKVPIEMIPSEVMLESEITWDKIIEKPDIYTKEEIDEKFNSYSPPENDETLSPPTSGGVDEVTLKEEIENHNSSEDSHQDIRNQIPINLSQLQDDSTHRLVTDEQIDQWDKHLIEIDESLSTSGMAADAAVVGQKIEKITNQIPTEEEYISPNELENYLKDYALKTEIPEIPELILDKTLTLEGVPADAQAVGVALSEKQPAGDYALKSELVKVDETISESSVNPVQNKAVYNEVQALNSKIGEKKVSAQIQEALTSYATEKYVDDEVAGIINSAPETLNTLNELAKALGDDPNFATTIANQIGAIDEKVGDSSVQEQIISAIDQELNDTSENAISNKTVNNAITNLNNKFQNYTTKEYVDDEISTIVANIPTLRELLLKETMILSSLQYGTTFPTDNLETGRIFYKKVT